MKEKMVSVASLSSSIAAAVTVTFLLTVSQIAAPAEGTSVFSKRWWNPNTKYAPIFYGSQYFDISENVGVLNISGHIAALGDFNSDRL